ncbi:MAG: hypothetical protein PUB69_06625 [Desulfovibrionaceae bacterium]|nr:hypothetical protein [Desulfovibrionaceae bacterium]
MALSRAIYRMCCIGLIKDYTQDYVGKFFRVVVSKLPAGGYYEALAGLMTKYYDSERARSEAEKARKFKGDNEIQKCLGFLTEFVYDKIAKKRWQAIEDMEIFCRTAVDNPDWLEANEQLKDYLYYYFNSKFARDQYTAPNGEAFSLTSDTDRGRISSFDIVKKYFRVIDEEICGSGSPMDSIKHLQGAVRLIRRAVTDINPALNLLHVFCLFYLNPQLNEHQKQEIESNYLEGCYELFSLAADAEECSANVAWFKRELGPEGRKIIGQDAVDMLEEWSLAAEAYTHVRKIRAILDNFLRK